MTDYTLTPAMDIHELPLTHFQEYDMDCATVGDVKKLLDTLDDDLPLTFASPKEDTAYLSKKIIKQGNCYVLLDRIDDEPVRRFGKVVGTVERNNLKIDTADLIENGKIRLTNTRNADSRTADNELTLESLREATENHIQDVTNCMNFFADLLKEIGKKHDYTKLENFEKEYGPLVLSKVVNEEFMANPWYKKHIFEERHHVNDDAKADVNLLDCLEHIADVVSAGKGRAGHISSMYCDINPLLLYRMYWNTIRMLEENIELEDENYRDYLE